MFGYYITCPQQVSQFSCPSDQRLMSRPSASQQDKQDTLWRQARKHIGFTYQQSMAFAVSIKTLEGRAQCGVPPKDRMYLKWGGHTQPQPTQLTLTHVKPSITSHSLNPIICFKGPEYHQLSTISHCCFALKLNQSNRAGVCLCSSEWELEKVDVVHRSLTPK